MGIIAGQSLHEAILAGLARAVAFGLTKPEDVSFSIQVALDDAGLKVIRMSASDLTKRDAERHAQAVEAALRDE